jgi:predicted glycosyltransferase involved in capsule biosynthesis
MFFDRLFKRATVSDNTKITLSLAYYNDGEHLNAQLLEFRKYPSNIKIQIIDDGSRDDPITNHLQKIPNNIEIYKIEEDIPWNIPGSRNLSATVSTTPWLLILDMDQIITLENMNKILELPLRNDYEFYSFNRKLGKINKFTAGTMLVSRSLWWECGGYDEDFIGNYGHNDPLFRFKMQHVGGHEKPLKNIWVKQESADCALNRNGVEVNKMLFNAKTKEYSRTADKKLRFSWKKIIVSS